MHNVMIVGSSVAQDPSLFFVFHMLHILLISGCFGFECFGVVFFGVFLHHFGCFSGSHM